MNKLNDKQEIEERTAFFYQYYGQNVMYVGGKRLAKLGFGGWNVRHPDFFIELTSLSDITDEHAIEVAKLIFSNPAFHTSEHGKRYIRQMITSELEYHGQYWSFSKVTSILDYLRSQGYLLPFRGYTTQQLIDLGWVKLRTNN